MPLSRNNNNNKKALSQKHRRKKEKKRTRNMVINEIQYIDFKIIFNKFSPTI